MLSGNCFRQAVHTRRASVHQAVKLVATFLTVVRVTAGLAESNDSLQQQRPFNGLSGTTRVGRYQKEQSPTHTHPDHRASFIIFLHLQRSMASSLFNLRA